MENEHSRFNLVLHGILAVTVNQDKNGLDILVPLNQEGKDGKPEPGLHKAYWGLPDSILPIPPHNFEICVPSCYPPGAPILPGPDGCVRFKHIDCDDNQVRSKISVPTPDVIRGFRYSEVPAYLTIDQDTKKLLYQVPQAAPLVLVLSWNNVIGPPVIGGRPISIGRVPNVNCKGTQKGYDFDYFYNLCIYFEPFEADPEPHPDIFNKMFPGLKVNGLQTTFDPDGPPVSCSPESGIVPRHLTALWELGYAAAEVTPKFAGSSDNCGATFVD